MSNESRFDTLRSRMVAQQLAGRGITDQRVLDAITTVPRHRFVPPQLADSAYVDSPLPIGKGQTISQPYIVALMAQTARIRPGDRVLDVGTGSGYGAAVLSRLADEVHTIERHAELSREAQQRLADVGYSNVTCHIGNGALGLPEQAPFDVIIVGAGGERVPRPLLDQLAVGGRLVIPVGQLTGQKLLLITRPREDAYEKQDLGWVAFVPLVDSEAEGPAEAGGGLPAASRPAPVSSERAAQDQLRAECEQFGGLEDFPLEALLQRIGEARVVCIGEATHGTSEFYRLRARITRALIERAGFNIVAAEADWPDARHIDNYVRGGEDNWWDIEAFVRFPTWMWRNEEVHEFAEWLRGWNASARRETGFYGLDLYSLFASIDAVLRYLDQRAPEVAAIARERYGCLMPWREQPELYGRLAITEPYRSCEHDVLAMQRELLERRRELVARDGEHYLDAWFNAQVVANAEQYYRIMYYGSVESWNLRDQHMFDSLKLLLEHYGPDARAVVWAHNSHLGDASATEMGQLGEHNIGQLCRREYGRQAYLIGFGTDHGTVLAASHWDGQGELKEVVPALDGSVEKFCSESGLPRFTLPLRGLGGALGEKLRSEQLERAIGVIYRPESERFSHYFHARVAEQFDEYIWLAETSAVTPLPARIAEEVPGTYPHGV